MATYLCAIELGQRMQRLKVQATTAPEAAQLAAEAWWASLPWYAVDRDYTARVWADGRVYEIELSARWQEWPV